MGVSEEVAVHFLKRCGPVTLFTSNIIFYPRLHMRLLCG